MWSNHKLNLARDSSHLQKNSKVLQDHLVPVDLADIKTL